MSNDNRIPVREIGVPDAEYVKAFTEARSAAVQALADPRQFVLMTELQAMDGEVAGASVTSFASPEAIEQFIVSMLFTLGMARMGPSANQIPADTQAPLAMANALKRVHELVNAVYSATQQPVSNTSH